MANPFLLLRALWADPRPFLPTIGLGLFSAAGFFTIAHLQQTRGLLAVLDAHVASGVLPDGALLRRALTGLPEVDGLLAHAVALAWPVVSADAAPRTVLFAAWYVGQLAALQGVVVVGAQRRASVQTILELSSFWGLFFQCIPWAILFPVYCISFLWLSPLARASSLVDKVQAGFIDAAAARAVPLSILLGLGLPSALAGLAAAPLRQPALAAWHAYPVYIAVLQAVLTPLLRVALRIPVPAKQSAQQRLGALRWMYSVLLGAVSLVHLGVVWYTVSPLLATRLRVDPASAWGRVAFADVFVPEHPQAAAPVASLAAGCVALWQYDVYFAAAAALAFVVYRGGVSGAAVFGLAVKVLMYGPAGAVLAWEKEQDVVVLRAAMEVEQADKEHVE